MLRRSYRCDDIVIVARIIEIVLLNRLSERAAHGVGSGVGNNAGEDGRWLIIK